MYSNAESALLSVWDRGIGCTPTRRAVLLLGLALPDSSEDARLAMSIGERDSLLLDLRSELFGDGFECVCRCACCGEQMELAFCAGEVGGARRSKAAGCEGTQAEGKGFRPATSADLLAIEGIADDDAAARRLLHLCRLPRSQEQVAGDVCLDEVGRLMLAADPRAEVLIDTTCPTCGQRAAHLFDIAQHLWQELDNWARSMLDIIHRLAACYHWSEAEILAMNPRRRAAYLDFAEAG